MERSIYEGISRFAMVLDGAKGTLVFGSGVPSIVGHIAHTGDDDYLVVEGHVSGDFSGNPQVYAVPLTSIVYFRWNPEEETD